MEIDGFMKPVKWKDNLYKPVKCKILRYKDGKWEKVASFEERVSELLPTEDYLYATFEEK
ncbi:MAG: hypothetical protein KKD18_00085 [Nanoarchaeota archaeon]|nr:hypothetical protein [Nanoarchaeota archaeon]